MDGSRALTASSTLSIDSSLRQNPTYLNLPQQGSDFQHASGVPDLDRRHQSIAISRQRDGISQTQTSWRKSMQPLQWRENKLCKEIARYNHKEPLSIDPRWNFLMENEGILSNEGTAFSGFRQQEALLSTKVFARLLQKCIDDKDLLAGREVLSNIVRSGFESHTDLGSHLIRMFTSFESLLEANYVFETLSNPNVFSWSAIISAHVKLGKDDQAIELYHQMELSSVPPDGYVFVEVLKACSKISSLVEGRQIHGHIVRSGLEVDMFIVSTLVDMYAKCGSIEDACVVFYRLHNRNVVTWSVLIAGYVQHDLGEKAIQLFQIMQEEGIQPDEVTFVGIIKACTSMLALEHGKYFHSHIIESGLELNVFVGNTLIDMYVKCGTIQDAHFLFDRLPEKNVVSWSALIAGYAVDGYGEVALQLFKQMKQEGLEPNSVTFICALKACSGTAALEQGRQIHNQITIRGLESVVIVGNTLIDMYCKCGSLIEAQVVFDNLHGRNIVTWSALIAGYGQHSKYALALQYFQEMQRAGLKPDNVAFVCLLSACSHVGLVEDGRLHFRSMIENHGIMPWLENYNTMVDLFGHAGYLLEAEDLLETIPFGSNIVGWTSLLSSCRKLPNANIGRRCFERVVAIDCQDSSAYVLMSNIYTYAGMELDARKVDKQRRSINTWKKPAKAYFEIDNNVHSFIVGEKTHPQSDDIYAKLRTLTKKMQQNGYEPYSELTVPHLLEGKQDDLCGHAEKLAIAFGLICTAEGTTIRVAKNLRMCANCHVTTKIISKIEMREIIVRDGYSIHYFQDGSCSCNL